MLIQNTYSSVSYNHTFFSIATSFQKIEIFLDDKSCVFYISKGFTFPN